MILPIKQDHENGFLYFTQGASTPNHDTKIMPHPHHIPRTLIGKGGIKLINLPGVIYPESILNISPGIDKRTGKAYAKAPSWGITTREAMRLLHCSAPAVRRKLGASKVKFHRVRRPDGPPEIYWNRKHVEDIARNSAPIVKTQPRKLLNTEEAIALLGLARSALYRYTHSGRLQVTVVRIMTQRGLRNRCFYRRSEIISLVKYIQSKRKNKEKHP
ncbi:helix-turn-helix transcriptional regulator [Akkermansia glycaniphila]|nr:helix-turn-helix domain-containing protein [Akkermansia glycaniphila]OCA02101.1 hypothetical protein AC781_13025 [Akkermansia glycaniphila]